MAQLKALRKTLFDPKIAEHHGRVVKNTGDGALVEFGSVVDAVRCAVEIQRGMAEHNIDVPEVKRIEFRIGIHVGDIIIEDHDIFGDGVNIAARLEGIAEPGGVCMSDDAYRQVRGKVEIACDDMGQQSLKNIADPMRAWRVRLTGQTPSAAISGSAVSEPRALALPDKPSIAVLPFQNMSGDPEQEYFADGMVEEIITALSRNKRLFVIARYSSFTFKGKAVDIKQVARDLGVRYVLEGSVRKSGNRIRITGQLIDAASGAHLWADRYDGALEDVFELQDQVAASVVGAIAPSVTQAEMERARLKPTSSLDAYDYYLRAQAAHWQYTREGLDQATGLYEQAIALDPQFAPAYAGLAAVLTRGKTWGWGTDPAADASQATAYAKTALRLGRQDASVMAQSALVLLTQGGEVELADSLLEEAIRLDPNGFQGWLWGGWAKTLLGEHQKAIDYHHRAMRLSPLDPRIFFAQSLLAYACFFLGNYEEGLKCAADGLRRHPSNVAALRAAMACHAMLGNIEAAQKLWQQVALLSPSDRVSETRKRAAFRDKDLAKIQEAYRLAGMPE
ncbi:MAG: adenylate/guanylate cyclase domain-containing protein [Bradyrhizobium sp.]